MSSFLDTCVVQTSCLIVLQRTVGKKLALFLEGMEKKCSWNVNGVKMQNDAVIKKCSWRLRREDFTGTRFKGKSALRCP